MLLALFIIPVILSLVLFLIKSKFANTYANFINSTVYIVITFLLINRPASFTPYFKIDSLNILFLLILAVLYFGISIYNIDFLRHSNASKQSHTYYTIFFLLFVLSMAGVLLSTHLALMWVFIEATTLTSSYLIYFNKTNSSLEAAWKYIFICSIGISLAFVGIILLSLGMGSINSLFFEDLYNNAKSINPFWLKLAFIFILVGLGTKAGLAPVHALAPRRAFRSSFTCFSNAFWGVIKCSLDRHHQDFKIDEFSISGLLLKEPAYLHGIFISFYKCGIYC